MLHKISTYIFQFEEAGMDSRRIEEITKSFQNVMKDISSMWMDLKISEEKVSGYIVLEHHACILTFTM